MWFDLRGDLRTARRMLLRSPGTSMLIIGTLALAIGTATIGFSFADLILFRGIPADDPKVVVSVFASDTKGANTRIRSSAQDYLALRERATSLECVSVFALTAADAFAALQVIAGPDRRVRRPRFYPAQAELLPAMQGGVRRREHRLAFPQLDAGVVHDVARRRDGRRIESPRGAARSARHPVKVEIVGSSPIGGAGTEEISDDQMWHGTQTGKAAKLKPW